MDFLSEPGVPQSQQQSSSVYDNLRREYARLDSQVAPDGQVADASVSPPVRAVVRRSDVTKWAPLVGGILGVAAGLGAFYLFKNVVLPKLKAVAAASPSAPPS